jgi:hypothetical protein
MPRPLAWFTVGTSGVGVEPASLEFARVRLDAISGSNFFGVHGTDFRGDS